MSLQTFHHLMVSMLDKHFSRQHFEIFLLFIQKVCFDLSCKLSLLRRHMIALSSAEFAHCVLSGKHVCCYALQC